MSYKCKDCKHWSGHASMVCKKEGWADPDCKPNGFFAAGEALDSMGLETWLVTGPDFGCVLFEAMDAKQPHTRKT